MSRKLILCALVSVGLGLAGCGKSAGDVPLAYAPAGSPFLFANIEAPPAKVVDAWLEGSQKMMPTYEQLMDTIIADVSEKSPTEAGARVISALRDEFKGKLSREGLESLGFSMSARTAIYGIGLVPVARIELGNADAFKALIARVETKVGDKLKVNKIGDQEYWVIGAEGEKLQVIIAVQNQHLVVTTAPVAAEESVLRSLLGIDKPKKSVLDTKTLATFNNERDFLPYGSGYMDTQKLFDLFLAPRSDAEQAFLTAFDVPNPAAEVSAVCKAEYASIAAQVPRLSFGYTAMDAKHMDIVYTIETTKLVGTELSKLAVSVPGLTGKGSGVIDFGFGIDLNALASFVNAKSAAVASAPYQCESLTSLNEAFASARTSMNNPGVFMAAAAIKGLHASLSKLDMSDATSPIIEGRIAFASENPQSLAAMVGNFVPQVATMSLKANEDPVALAMDAMPAGVPPVFVAMSDKALGVALGEAGRAGLRDFLNAPTDKASPWIYYGLDGNGLATIMDGMIKQSEAALARLGDSGDEDAEDDEEQDGVESASASAELTQAIKSMQAARDIYQQMIRRIDFSATGGERGVTFAYSVEMK